MYKKVGGEIKHEKIQEFDQELGGQGKNLKKATELKVVQNNAVKKNTIRPST